MPTVQLVSLLADFLLIEQQGRTSWRNSALRYARLTWADKLTKSST